MRILVTGAAGFIGAHLCESLARLGENNILAVDSYSSYYSSDLKRQRVSKLLSPSGVAVEEVDLTDKNQVDELFREFAPERVFHLAAQAGVRIPPERYCDYFESNLKGFANVLTATTLCGGREFLYASSSSVYGNRAVGTFKEGEEGLVPSSIYGSTKLCNETLARTFSLRHGLRTRGLRFFTVYGPWGRPDMAYLRVINALLNRTSFNVYGDGHVQRDFTYVTDTVTVSIRLANELSRHEEGYFDVVNVGGGQPASLNEMILTLESIFGFSLNRVRDSSDPSDVKLTMSNSTYLESLIGIQEFLDLKTGLEKVVDWARSDVTPMELETWVRSTD